MQKIIQKKIYPVRNNKISNGIYRILDANGNRTKEALRVCEDIARFILNDPVSTLAYKNIRHRMGHIYKKVGILSKEAIAARSVGKDVGRTTTTMELHRKEAKDVFYANSQRMKESVRVLEEFAKLLNKDSAVDLKKIRYRIYAVEQVIIKNWK